MAPRNPIEVRLETLDQQWTSFREDGDARQLHWLIEPDEWRMLDLFFTVEDSPDAFFVVDVPFADEQSHGLELRTWLRNKYAEVEPELLDAGARGGWTPPPLATGADDIDAFLAAAQSLWEHHQPLFEYLVAVLVPESVAAPEVWQRWLDRLFARGSENLRFVVPDYFDAPSLAPLAIKHALSARTVIANLDMPGAYVDLSADAGGLDTPAGMFRHAFVQMSNALSTGELAIAEEHAKLAKTVAKREGWAHLSFAVEFAQGSGSLGRGDTLGAIAYYREAETQATQAHDAGEDFGLGLVLKARLGQGAACVAGEAYREGASVYEAAAPVAKGTGDRRSELDCLRMAAYCHERDGLYSTAWTRGVEALAVGDAMSTEERTSSTLPYAGEGLLRVCKTPGFAGREPSVESKMRSLLGDDWRPN